MAEGNERGSSSSKKRRLHNFTLPELNWGRGQRILRCVGIESIDLNESPPEKMVESPVVNSGHRIPRFNESNEVPEEVMVESPVVNSGHRIPRFNESNEVPEEVMMDLEDAADRLQISMEEKKEKGKGKKKAKEKVQQHKSVPDKTWNLRPRRAAEVNGGGGRSGGIGSSGTDGGGGGSNGNGGERGMNSNLRSRRQEKLNKQKFSYTLTNEEIESDLAAMSGAKPPRKLKKRPKAIQRKLDVLSPGIWLRDVKQETYKVTDNPEPRKGRK